MREIVDAGYAPRRAVCSSACVEPQPARRTPGNAMKRATRSPANVCPRCGAPVRVAVMRRSGRQISLDMEPRADGGLAIDEHGFAAFIASEARWPKHRAYVPERDRYVSHMATCGKRALEVVS